MSKESKKKTVDRRTFLKIAGGTAVVAVGYSILKPKSMARIENRIADMLPFSQKTIANQQLLPEVFADEHDDTENCTTIVVGSKATANGSVLTSHNEDDSSWDEANVFIVPRKAHDPGEFYQSYYGAMIPQPPQTYAYTWWGCPDKDWVPGDFYVGMNEYQVTISSNTDTPKEPTDSGMLLIWSDFMRLALERSKTAKEAVQQIGYLVDTYGGDVSDPGMMYGIADKNEGWWIETTPHHWAAVRVPDTGYWRAANRLTIDTPDLGSATLQTFAKDQGWWDGISPFSFKDAYGDLSNQNNVRNIYREQRVDFLLKPKVGSIHMEDLKAIMRDHYEGRTDPTNPPYYNVDPVHGSPHVGAKFRNVCVSSTEVSFVAELRSSLPDPIGGLMWATLGCSCTSVYLPYYVGTQSIPAPFMTGLPGSTNYNPASAWWTYERLQHTIDNNYPAAEPHVRQVLDDFEKGAKNDSKTVEQNALKAYSAGKTQQALSILTAFTTSKLNDGFNLLNGMTGYAYAKTHGLYPAIPGLT